MDNTALPQKPTTKTPEQIAATALEVIYNPNGPALAWGGDTISVQLNEDEPTLRKVEADLRATLANIIRKAIAV